MGTNRENSYGGFEIGPIRPPSEAASLLLRVTRNCPWNKCTFCGLYKGKTFGIRSVDHVLRDIDAVRRCVDDIRGGATPSTQPSRDGSDPLAYQSALNWVRGGLKSVFLQDANTLAVRPDDLVTILRHLRGAFPQVERVTSYARSKTVARISDEDMTRLAEAGLNRIHIGMESAADEVLAFVRKGVDKQTHILAGQKVKRAGIELSEYFMPGLGGMKYSEANAVETADALNQIDPDFIRIRTLAIPESIELHNALASGAFEKLGDVDVAAELLLFLENLDGIHSTVKSDHILNLFQEVEGGLPDARDVMQEPIRAFLAMEPGEQALYIAGRRAGVFSQLSDLTVPHLRQHAERIADAHGITPDNVEDFAADMMKRFI